MRVTSAVFGATIILACASAHALPTVSVGNCNQASVSFSTIGGAISHLPDAGGTVKICPGVYPEQIVINKPVKLVGIPSANASNPTITVPAGGVVVNTAYLYADSNGSHFPVAAQVLVTNTNASISNITVDGTGNGISSCTPDLVGIYYQDATGTVVNNAVVNQAILNGTNGLGGCQSGEAIYVESDNINTASSVIVKNNDVFGYQKNGITVSNAVQAAQLNVTVQQNTVIGQGPTAAIAANAVQISYGATGSVNGNILSSNVYTGPTYGSSSILVYASPNVSVFNNTITESQYPIAVVGDYAQTDDGLADGAQITGNSISLTPNYDAIDLCDSSNDSVKNNTIMGTPLGGAIHIDSECGAPSTNDAVFGNKINYACAGILVGSGSETPTGVNNSINTANAVLPNSDVCPVAVASMAMLRSGVKHRLLSPVRH